MLDINKLNKVSEKAGKKTAQCPACAVAGHDEKGEHLVIFDDGKYACVKNPGDKQHNREIHKLAGRKGYAPPYIVPIQRLEIPESQVLLKFGVPEPGKPVSGEHDKQRMPEQNPAIAGLGEQTGQGNCQGWGKIDGVTIEEAEEFLNDKIA